MPKVVEATAFINELYFILKFLKNIKEHIPVTTDKNVFESVTKKNHKSLFNLTESHVQQITDKEHSNIQTIVKNPHTLVLEKIFFGYSRIYEDIKYNTINHET